MKTILKILLLGGLIGITVFSCRKEKIIPRHNTNITLYDKPIDVILANIMGKWDLRYGKGGIAANTVQYFHNYIWEFTSDNKIIQTYNDTIECNSYIQWRREKYMNGFTYLMSVCGWNYTIVNGIYNDTLVLSGYGPDAMSYYFTRSN